MQVGLPAACTALTLFNRSSCCLHVRCKVLLGTTNASCWNSPLFLELERVHHLGLLLAEVPQVQRVVRSRGDEGALVRQKLDLQHGRVRLVTHVRVHAGTAQSESRRQGKTDRHTEMLLSRESKNYILVIFNWKQYTYMEGFYQVGWTLNSK